MWALRRAAMRAVCSWPCGWMGKRVWLDYGHVPSSFVNARVSPRVSPKTIIGGHTMAPHDGRLCACLCRYMYACLAQRVHLYAYKARAHVLERADVGTRVPSVALHACARHACTLCRGMFHTGTLSVFRLRCMLQRCVFRRSVDMCTGTRLS